jgi:hypothetical protein
MSKQNARELCRKIEANFNLDASYIPSTGEWRINLRTAEGGNEDTAYYTDDADDAYQTAKAMREFETKRKQ